jgi:hypothetical protein
MTVWKSITYALMLTIFGLSPVFAQEEPTTPGAIPNPGTYQGSQELQRQSDQQDQQFRQQQQQQSTYQQPIQSDSRGQQQWSGGSGLYPADYCAQRLAASPHFAPLAGKMSLGSGDPRAIELFGNSLRPSAADKVLIAQWLEGKRHCSNVWLSSPPRPTQAQLIAYSRWGFPALLPLVRQLLAGQLTYGQFNSRRAMNQVSMDHYLAGN